MPDILCLDIDWIPPPEWLKAWTLSRYVLYASLGYTVDDIREEKSPSGMGLHVWITIAETVSDEERNKLQFLGGDDPTRTRINRYRTDRGIVNLWNKLFSDGWTNPDYKGRPPNCKECKLVMYLKEMSKNG